MSKSAKITRWQNFDPSPPLHMKVCGNFPSQAKVNCWHSCWGLVGEWGGGLDCLSFPKTKISLSFKWENIDLHKHVGVDLGFLYSTLYFKRCHVLLHQTSPKVFMLLGVDLNFLASQDIGIKSINPFIQHSTWVSTRTATIWFACCTKKRYLLSHMLVPMLHTEVLDHQDDWKLCRCQRTLFYLPR